MWQWTDGCHPAYFRQAIVLRESDGDEAFDRNWPKPRPSPTAFRRISARYYPVSGKRLMPRNMFPQDVARSQPGLRHRLLRCLRVVKCATAFRRSLPRRVVLRVYQSLLGRLAVHIKYLDGQLRTIEGPMQRLDGYFAKSEPNWIPTEYKLRREIGLLRVGLEDARNERVGPVPPRKTGKAIPVGRRLRFDLRKTGCIKQVLARLSLNQASASSSTRMPLRETTGPPWGSSSRTEERL